MATSPQIVALNIGSQRLSMGVFSIAKTGELVLERYGSRTMLMDPAAEGLRITKIGESMAELVQELGVQKETVNYAVSGQSVLIRFIKLPPLDSTDVETLIEFEAQQHIPFPLAEVVWSYHLLPSNGLEQEVLLVAMKASEIDELNAAALSPGSNTVGMVDCAQTALFNAFCSSYPHETAPVLIVDIGAKSTELIYCENGRFFTRSISAGGTFITTAIARKFNIPFLEAEHLKINEGQVPMNSQQIDGMDERQRTLATAIRDAMSRLASEILRTTNHYRAQMNGSAPAKIFLCGGGAALPYTKEFLESKLNLPVEFLNPMHQVSVGRSVAVDTISAEAFMLGGMIGVAVHAAGQAAIDINLEPTAVAANRENKKHMPAVITGMAVAVAGAAIFTLTGWLAKQQAQDALDKLTPQTQAVQQARRALQNQANEIETLNGAMNAYRQLTLQRFGYADIIKDLLEETNNPDYPYWFTDFKPIAYYDVKNKGGITGYSVVKDSFGTDKAESMLANTEPAGWDWGDEVDDDNKPYLVNAIRLEGLVRKNLGDTGLINKLKDTISQNPASPFTFKDKDGNPLDDSQFLILGAGGDSRTEQQFGAFSPFTIVLPLKEPIPVTLSK